MGKVGGRLYNTYGDAGIEALMGPSLLVPIVKDDEDQFDPCLGIWVGAAGTANLTFAGDVDVDGIPLHVGWNQIRVIGVREGGTADELFAGY